MDRFTIPDQLQRTQLLYITTLSLTDTLEPYRELLFAIKL